MNTQEPQPEDVTPRRHSAESPIQQRITAAASALRTSLSKVISSIEGRPSRTMTLARALGIHKNLAGRVLNAIKDRDPFATALRLPAPQGLRLFLSAAADQGVPKAVVTAAARAVQDFENLIAQDAGDRDTLDAMISGWMPDVRGQGERNRKQAAFKAMSYLLGYQVDARFGADILQPNTESPDMCDLASVFGFRGLRRLRPRAPVMVAVMGTPLTGRAAGGDSFFQPLSDDAAGGRYVLAEYSTSPLPQLSVHDEGDTLRFMLEDAALGPDAGVDLTFANMVRAGTPRHASPGRREEPYAVIQWVTRVMIHDVFLRDDVWPASVPRLTMSVVRPGDRMPPGPSSDIPDRLEFAESIQPLGRGTDGIHTPDVPRYAEMINRAFDRLGWDRERFRGYRLRVQYPIPSMVYCIWFELPDKPPAAG